jgi:hypothetical protein
MHAMGYKTTWTSQYFPDIAVMQTLTIILLHKGRTVNRTDRRTNE